VGFAVANVFGALFHNLTGGRFANEPVMSPNGYWYRQLHRASKNFALVADLTVASLGGGLKVHQRTTGRLADALSEMYFLACLLKRFEDDGKLAADVPFVDYCAQNCLARFYAAMDAAIANHPVALLRPLLRLEVFPLGNRFRPARDTDAKTIVRLALEPGDVRDRLTREIYVSRDTNDAAGVLEVALTKVVLTDAADRKLEKAVREGKVRRFLGHDWFGEAVEKGVLTAEEALQLREAEALVAKVIAVDHFDAAEIAPAAGLGHNSRMQPPGDAHGGNIYVAE
jgi:acyl-CoA dehydrogenase